MNRELENYKRDFPANVYQEAEVPLGKIRVWLSVDINEDQGSVKKEAIWNMLTPNKVETWGDSVYTYLDNDKSSNTLKAEIVRNLQDIEVLDRVNWQNTPNISIYVIWRRHTSEGEHYTGYFTLIQNAEISHLQKMIDNNVE